MFAKDAKDVHGQGEWGGFGQMRKQWSGGGGGCSILDQEKMCFYSQSAVAPICTNFTECR